MGNALNVSLFTNFTSRTGEDMKTKTKFFTLLEVLISMGVFCLLMLALMQFFSSAQDVWEKSGSRSELYDSAGVAIQLLRQDLSSAFCGDDEYDMTKYRFFAYKKDKDKINITFATQYDQGQNSGLTKVDYQWDEETLELSVFREDEKSTFKVTRPDKLVWINNMREGTHAELLSNVCLFSVKCCQYDDSTRELKREFEALSGSEKVLPPILYFTIGVVSEKSFRQIIQMAGLTKESQKKQAGYVKSIFDAVYNSNGKFIEDSLDDGKTKLRERQELHSGTQIFHLSVNTVR